ncbi:tetratricopeptide repeat protein [Streptomyces aculeolatus]
MRVERVRALLALPSGRDGEALPAVADVDTYGELAGSRGLYSHGTLVPQPQPQWLRRELDDSLRERSIVLLAGANRAAKWRAGFEAVCRTLPNARLLVPRLDTGALAELLELQPPLHGNGDLLVVWLEGIERYLTAPDALGGGWLERTLGLSQRVVVLATVSGNLWEVMRKAEGVSRETARQMLDAAVTIEVPSPAGHGAAAAGQKTSADATEAPSGTGDEDAALQPPPPEAAALERRFRDGYRGAEAGWAVVKAAVDWRRVGLSRAVTEAELRELVVLCVPAGESGDDAWAEALGWALAAPGGAALLGERPPAGNGARVFQPHPHIVAHADTLAKPLPADIPAAVWEFALRRSDAFELMQLAGAAAERGRKQIAQRAWRRAALSLDPMVASVAGFLRGANLAGRGGKAPDATGQPPDTSRARRSGHSRPLDGEAVFSAVERSNRAQTMAEQGDRDGAVRLYREVLGEDDPIGTPLAGLNLAAILRGEGDLAGARSAYERTLACCTAHGDPTGMHGAAAGHLGEVLAELGEPGAARRAFEVAIASGHRDAKPRAWAELGDLRRAEGDVAGAVAAYREAIDADDPGLAAAARFKLALGVQDTDPGEALTHYRHLARATGLPSFVAAQAGLRLGRLLHGRGDSAGAREAFEQVAAGRDSAAAPWAAFELGALFAESDQLPAAAAALRDAAGSGHADVAPRACGALGHVLMQLSDLDGAVAAYQKAVDSGHREAAPWAAHSLAIVLRQQGDLHGALQACRVITEGGIGPKAAEVLLLQGDIHRQLRQPKAASDAYWRVVANGALPNGDAQAARLASERLRAMGFG